MLQSRIFKRIAICMLGGLVFGAVVSEASYYFLGHGESRPPEIVEIQIPLGTAARIRQGQSDPTLPSSMTFVVGDTLLVRNLDSVVHQLGPLIIPAGASSLLRLESTQEYAATCTFQPTNYMGLSIQPPLTLGTRVIGILEAGIPMGILLVLYGVFAIPTKKMVSI